MVIFWVSPVNVSRVRFTTPEGKFLWEIVSDVPQQYKYWGEDATQGHKRNYKSNFIHEVTLRWLKPENTFYYQCGDPENGYSEKFRFKTRSNDADAPVRFSAFADQGPDFTDPDSPSQSVLRKLVEDRLADGFALHAGDATYADGNQARWDAYGRFMEPFASRVPVMYAVGNKDMQYDGSPFNAWLRRYRNNENVGDEGWGPFWYSFDYGPVHIVVLSSEHEEVGGEKQWDWLASDLEKADRPESRQRTPFIIAVIHREIYNSGVDGLSPSLRYNMEPLFEKHRVSIVITGHCHNYERTKPMYNGAIVNLGRGSDREPYTSNLFNPKESKETHGTVYLTLGTGGKSGDPCPSRPWTIGNTLKLFGYGGFTASRERLQFRFVDIRGRIRDSFQICSQPGCLTAPAVSGDLYWPKAPPRPPTPPPAPPAPPAPKAPDSSNTPLDNRASPTADEPVPNANSEPGSNSTVGAAKPVGEECAAQADLVAQSGPSAPLADVVGDRDMFPDIRINSMGSGCTTDIVTSVPFKVQFPDWFLRRYPENMNTRFMVLPGVFIATFLNNTAEAAGLDSSDVDLYGATSDGNSTVLAVDVVFPIGTSMEKIKEFRDKLMFSDTRKIYTGFVGDEQLFTILSSKAELSPPVLPDSPSTNQSANSSYAPPSVPPSPPSTPYSVFPNTARDEPDQYGARISHAVKTPEDDAQNIWKNKGKQVSQEENENLVEEGADDAQLGANRSTSLPVGDESRPKSSLGSVLHITAVTAGIESKAGLYAFWGCLFGLILVLILAAILLSCKALRCCCFAGNASDYGDSESNLPVASVKGYENKQALKLEASSHPAGVLQLDTCSSLDDITFNYQNEFNPWRLTEDSLPSGSGRMSLVPGMSIPINAVRKVGNYIVSQGEQQCDAVDGNQYEIYRVSRGYDARPSIDFEKPLYHSHTKPVSNQLAVRSSWQDIGSHDEGFQEVRQSLSSPHSHRIQRSP